MKSGEADEVRLSRSVGDGGREGNPPSWQRGPICFIGGWRRFGSGQWDWGWGWLGAAEGCVRFIATVRDFILRIQEQQVGGSENWTRLLQAR
ncbi:hypothetical protein AAFF_G00148430 [Aldrovandia affinis]|uniref:Uncharacterized protein n=1 Tax=Aldrovandia affinis TaxID=143900 RepID=A0AAD7RPE0_9TELE|nr:hypothetical protein AAFF_G00148430 [Aldrovandia affinis]